MATRIDIARAVAEKERISIQDANSIIGSTIEAVKEAVQKEDVRLVGLGTFRRLKRQARQARNPRTGETVAVPAKTVIRFKPSKSLNPAAGSPKGSRGPRSSNKGAGSSTGRQARRRR